MKYKHTTMRYFVILLFSASLIYSSADAVDKKKAARSDLTETLSLDKAVRVGTLSNGFTYYIRKNAEPKNRVTLYLANKVGSILETDEQQGLAHFIEHMSFNGTKHFPKNQLVSYLQKSGVRFGGDLNAYTNFDETVYQLPLPTDNPELLKNGFQIMRDWAHEALLDSVEIDKERGVILEEKRLGKNAQQRLQNKYLPVLLNQSRYSNRLPIGTEEVLTGFHRTALQRFYHDWYRPDLQALIVVGDIDIAAVEKTVRELFADLKKPIKSKSRIVYTVPLTAKNQFLTATDKEMSVSVIQVMVKDQSTILKTNADYRQSLLTRLFNNVVRERFADLSRQPNVPFIHAKSAYGSFIANLSVFSTIVVSRSEQQVAAFKYVWTEVERIKKYGFTESELKRAKLTVLRSFESAYNEKDKTPSEQYIKEYLQHFLQGEASPGIESEFVLCKKYLPEITLAELNDLAKEYIADRNRDIIVLGPEKDATAMPKEAEVNCWMEEVRNSSIAPPKGDTVKTSLIDKKLRAGKIVAEKKIPELGLITLTLNNGVKVNLKPTDFRNDEVIFSAFSPGGTSLYNDVEYESANRAADLINSSGVGTLTQTQLEKFLSGKKVGVTSYVGERFEGVSGYSSPKDMETALQLVYLYFTQPRKDKSVYQVQLDKETAVLINRSNDPTTVFSDTVSSVLSNYSIRRTGPSIQKLNSINLDRAFDIYKQRFADAGDFTFTFVGNLDVEQLKPLLELYLGSLPYTGSKENARDLHIQIPAGKIEKKVFKGVEQKSTVQMVFSGAFNYSEDEVQLLKSLADLLTIKLTESLREEESCVYGVSAQSFCGKFPRNRYSFSIAFGCAPSNVEKLIAAAQEEMKKLREKEPSQEDVDKVVSEDLRSTELALKRNKFWLNYIIRQSENDDDLFKVLSYEQDMKKITPKNLKNAANKYLTDDNFIKIVLYPNK